MKEPIYDILIQNTRILTPDMTIRSGVDVAIKDGMISSICSSGSLSCQEAEQTVDGSRLLWMPGLTDGHMHTCQQLLRGKILDALPMIWTRIMLPFESTLTPEAVSLSAALCSLEMIRGGTTSFLDAGGIHMDEAAKVYIKSGLRGALTLSTMDDTKVPDSMRADAAESISRLNEYYNTWNGSGDGRLSVYYSLRSLISCSEELIRGVFEAASERSAMVEAHMNEYPNEINYHLERYQMRPMEYLDSLGVLSDHFVSAHSLLLSEHEIELMAANGVKAVHCPFSNCGKGVPNTPRLLESGISVAFMPAETILSMALEGGSCALGLHNKSGQLKEGFCADLIAVDLDQPHLYPTNNLIHTLVESVSSQDVIHSIAAGKFLMKNREILTLDEEKIRFEAHSWLTKNHLMEDELCYR